jgi:dolichol-phosphate mannosyltransferase
VDSFPVVIIPTYNEAANIGALLEAVLTLPARFHVLVIDDHSPDGTAGVVQDCQARAEYQGRIHLLERPGKLGLGTAYLKGFAWALERGYPKICEMDADFSHKPEDLPRLLEAAEGAGLAVGTRYMPGGGCEGWSRLRLILSRTANLYARIVTGIPLRDLTGGFKCYRREALAALRLPDIRSEGYAFQIETTAHVVRAGFKAAEVPIVFQERLHGKSKLSRGIVWEAIWTVLRLR